MRKILTRILLILVVVMIMCNTIISYQSYATDYSTMMQQAKDFVSKGETKAGEMNVDPAAMAQNFVGLGQILTMVGMGVMIAVTTYMGIKYLTAGPEGQAKLKQQLIGLVVAAIVIFGGYYIWSWVLDIVEKFD